jgi:hypothetical protein
LVSVAIIDDVPPSQPGLGSIPRIGFFGRNLQICKFNFVIVISYGFEIQDFFSQCSDKFISVVFGSGIVNAYLLGDWSYGL